MCKRRRKMKKKLVFFFYICCIVLLCITITSCYIHTKVHSVNTENIRESKKFVIKKPTKVHLIDGSLLVFEKGLEIKNNTLKGEGIRYDLSRQNQYPFSEVTMDSVVCVKYYKKGFQVYPSLMSNPILVFILGSIIYQSIEGGDN